MPPWYNLCTIFQLNMNVSKGTRGTVDTTQRKTRKGQGTSEVSIMFAIFEYTQSELVEFYMEYDSLEYKPPGKGNHSFTFFTLFFLWCEQLTHWELIYFTVHLSSLETVLYKVSICSIWFLVIQTKMEQILEFIYNSIIFFITIFMGILLYINRSSLHH